MKMNKKIALAIALIISVAPSALAQSFQEGFMLKDYRQVYRFNPALAGEQDFLSLFNVSTSQRNNVGASAFIYPYEGQVVTFLHSSVPVETVRNNVQKDNYLTKNIDFNLVSYGMYRNGATHTFEINIRGNSAVSVPGALCMLAKAGTGATTFDFSSLRAQGEVYAELAYGYTRKLSDVVSIGGRVKLLAGFYALDFNVTRFDLSTGASKYQADIEAELAMTDTSLEFGVGDDYLVNFKDLTFKGLTNFPKSYGAAVDLGIAVTPIENLTISASVVDLGGIFWHCGNSAKSSGTVSFAGLKDLTVDNFNKDGLMAQVNILKDEFLSQMSPVSEEKKTRFRAIPFSSNLGVKYAMPFYDRLSAGITGQYLSYQSIPYMEGRFALACNPVDWFDCTANIGTGTFGMVWGAAANICFHRFILNMAYENGFGGNIPGKGTPLQANYKSFSFGLTYSL